MSRFLFAAVLVCVAVFGICKGQIQEPDESTRTQPDESLLQQCFSNNQRLQAQVTSLQDKICDLRVAALFLLGSENNPASSCLEIAQHRSNVTSGAYYLKVDGETIKVYCYMEELGSCGGQGWTTVMKVDGTKTTFGYDSTLWSSTSSHNIIGGSTRFDNSETKLPTYHNLQFNKLCLVFRPSNGESLGYILIEREISKTLFSLIGDGVFRSVSVGRSQWLSALPVASLQQHCDKEGFNSIGGNPGNVRTRIGILGNNENNCVTPDSVFGVGIKGSGCHATFTGEISAGNINNPLCAVNGNVKRHAFVYIVAQ